MKLITPLVALVLLSLASDVPDLTTIQLNGRDCGPEGSAKKVKVKALNRLKNRFIAPTTDQIDESVTLAAMLAPGDDDPSKVPSPFNEQAGATVTGFVTRVIPGGIEFGETCNCESKALAECDTHIELSLSTTAPPTQRVIVEVTPRLRILAKMRGEDWSTDALRDRLQGKWVEFTGWMLFDAEHVDKAENTNPGNPANFRATCWEIHPVTSFQVLDGPPSPAFQLSPESLGAVQRAHAEAVKIHPKKREFIRARNQRVAAEYEEH